MFVSKSRGVGYIIAGLGNPGSQYEKTRHNTGYMALDYISGRLGAKPDRLKHMSLCCRTKIGEAGVLLMKPQTYMNNSGEAIRDAADFYKVAHENIILIYDDISLPAGSVRIRKEGSAGGHNGIKSVISELGSDKFLRIKIGVGSNGDKELVGYVLGKFTADEESVISENFENIYKAVCLITEGKIENAISKYNKKVKDEK